MIDAARAAQQVICLRVDSMEAVNDRSGHAAGDPRHGRVR
jgi:GGDEF domain-containing protein